jgi:hypothetical protein
MTDGYKRNEITTSFRASNLLDGKAIGSCMPRASASRCRTGDMNTSKHRMLIQSASSGQKSQSEILEKANHAKQVAVSQTLAAAAR